MNRNKKTESFKGIKKRKGDRFAKTSLNDMRTAGKEAGDLLKTKYGDVLSSFNTPFTINDKAVCRCLTDMELDNAFTEV